MKKCDHFREGGYTGFRNGTIEASCYGCGKDFLFPIDLRPPLWIIERLKGILTAVNIFETVNNGNGTTSIRPIESDCCKYK